MPLPKVTPPRQPDSREREAMAQRNGLRATVSLTNGDTYTGEWCEDQKHGKGTYVMLKGGKIYDGDWRHNRREGYGVLGRKISGSTYVKEYAGSWKGSKRHGQGTNFYANGEQYDGEWQGGQRHGWGRMVYLDGGVYEGEWLDDKRHGQGLLLLGNGDRFEGSWAQDQKHGSGNFYYVTKKYQFTGVWVHDAPRGGEMLALHLEDERSLPQVVLASRQLLTAS